MINQMINLDPSCRPTFDTLLHTSRGTVFPECFYSFLHNYVSSINDLPSNPPYLNATFPTAATAPSSASVAPSISGTTLRPSSSVGLLPTGLPGAETPSDTLPSDSDHRMDRIWSDYESVEPYLVPDTLEETVMNVKVEYNTSTSVSRPFQVRFYFEFSLSNAL